MSESTATVDIADVFADAQRIPVHALIVGDQAFDTMGHPTTILDITLRRVRGSKVPFVWIKTPSYPDLWEPWCFLDEEVTVIPATRETQEV